MPGRKLRRLEYDWIPTPRSLVHETSGLTHTLVSDDPNDVKLFGLLKRPIDFYDENAGFVHTLYVWWFMNHYETYCRERRLAINKQLDL